MRIVIVTNPAGTKHLRNLGLPHVGEQDLELFVDQRRLDAEYFVEFMVEATREVQGSEVTMSTVLGDYKEVDGLLLPHAIENRMGGQTTMTLMIDTGASVTALSQERFEECPNCHRIIYYTPPPKKEEGEEGSGGSSG